VHGNLVVSLLWFLDDRSMDVVTGAVSCVITKLSDLLAGEYNLQMGVKGGDPASFSNLSSGA